MKDIDIGGSTKIKLGPYSFDASFFVKATSSYLASAKDLTTIIQSPSRHDTHLPSRAWRQHSPLLAARLCQVAAREPPLPPRARPLLPLLAHCLPTASPC